MQIYCAFFVLVLSGKFNHECLKNVTCVSSEVLGYCYHSIMFVFTYSTQLHDFSAKLKVFYSKWAQIPITYRFYILACKHSGISTNGIMTNIISTNFFILLSISDIVPSWCHATSCRLLWFVCTTTHFSSL